MPKLRSNTVGIGVFAFGIFINFWSFKNNCTCFTSGNIVIWRHCSIYLSQYSIFSTRIIRRSSKCDGRKHWIEQKYSPVPVKKSITYDKIVTEDEKSGYFLMTYIITSSISVMFINNCLFASFIYTTLSSLSNFPSIYNFNLCSLWRWKIGILSYDINLQRQGCNTS